MTPLELTGHAADLASLFVGFLFGFVLERGGLADSRRLAAQFYLHEQRVLKVMFSAIVVAMLLLGWAAGVGLLAPERLYVNPTYLGPGILGGLLLGMGFIVGGYCPGTSIVATATLKLDALAFVLGCLCGVTAFGESVAGFETFFEGDARGRVTLPEAFGLPSGVVVVGVVVMAIGMFRGAEALERRFARFGEGTAR